MFLCNNVYFLIMCHFYVELFFLIINFSLVKSDEFDNAVPLNRFNYRNIRTCKHRPYDPFYHKSIFESTFYLIFIVLLGILFGLLFLVKSDEFDNAVPLNRFNYRNIRTCKHHKSIFENTFYLLFMIILGILFGLLFLGCIKGLLGICGSKKIGQYGMAMLIDLPKPLDAYQERELKDRPVSYDVVGWPVHPDTGERTVRALPIKIEFCLNIVFFVAYPMAIILKLCSMCCCIRDYKGETDGCFKEVNVIKCKKSKKDSFGPQVDMYKENDLREATDTNYVINCMRQSQMSLEKLHQFKDM